MMTFDEFFIKKKIDLARLQQAKPDLYEEFKSHYAEMGEKSFDHTKKYWFNRLRKEFLLVEEVTPPTPVVPTHPATEKSANPASEESPQKPAGFTPRFKPGLAKPKTEVPDPTAKDAPSEKPKVPTGFKPRFKPGVTPVAKPPVENKPESDENTAQPPAMDPKTDTPKPLGFKPRFKAGTTPTPKTESPSPTEDKRESNPETPAPKPLGFKPRFKAGITGPAKSADDPVNKENGPQHPKKNESDENGDPS